jgi:hypothetical protein
MEALVGTNPDQVRKEFGKLANKFTGGDMTDAVMERASEKISKRPRTAEAEMEKGV